ncbi:MAG: 50S ribosomal protein L24 [Myxococcota bacterium]|nr:50S ribosomal protein L24 [Myxococcota bacterium]
MKKFKLKAGDLVVVTAGKNKKKTGKILKVLRESDRVIVEGLNMVTRQVKPTAERQGGTIKKEASIHISNVALWNADENRPFKIGWKVLEDGRKVRFDKKTNVVIDEIEK